MVSVLHPIRASFCEKIIRVSPEEACGEVDPNGFKEVPKSDLPFRDPQIGTPLSARGPQGEELLIHIREVRRTTVILDFNHPFAGKTLNFPVKVLGIDQKEAR